MDMQPFWSLGVPTVGTGSLPGVNSDFPRSKVPRYDVQTSSVYIYNMCCNFKKDEKEELIIEFLL